MSTPAVVNAAKREAGRKGPSRRLRAQKLIPAVVYGLQKTPTPVAVDPKALEKAIATPHKFNTLLNLKTPDGDKLVLFKEYQVDPVTRKLLHADFLEVTLDKPVKVEVPVVTVGKADGVTAGGILTVSAHEVVVEALPNKIPAQIEVDVTPIKIGGSLHISEVKTPEGCKIKFHTDYVVAFVAVPEKEEVVAAVAPVPGAEGAVAAPGAPGAAPAAGAAPGAPGTAPAAGAKPAAGAPAKGAEGKGEKGKK
jgi:large subunit ribosomal protein L25